MEFSQLSVMPLILLCNCYGFCIHVLIFILMFYLCVLQCATYMYKLTLLANYLNVETFSSTYQNTLV